MKAQQWRRDRAWTAREPIQALSFMILIDLFFLQEPIPKELLHASAAKRNQYSFECSLNIDDRLLKTTPFDTEIILYR